MSSGFEIEAIKPISGLTELFFRLPEDIMPPWDGNGENEQCLPMESEKLIARAEEIPVGVYVVRQEITDVLITASMLPILFSSRLPSVGGDIFSYKLPSFKEFPFEFSDLVFQDSQTQDTIKVINQDGTGASVEHRPFDFMAWY